MGLLNDHIREYTLQLGKGHIQKAYRGIMVFMSDLRTHLECRYPDHAVSALYYGYMDMTYFAFTPPPLKSRKLKLAIVYLHEECRFEVWLAGNNRHVQSDYIRKLGSKDLDGYTLSQIGPGVDSIIASVIVERPDFDDLDKLAAQIEQKAEAFAGDMVSLLD